MTYKKSQLLMMIFLPVIVIGGLFYPLLGYLVVAMMAFFLSLSFFKGRYWCWNLCPRGAFLDIVMSKASMNRPLPGFFATPWFRLPVSFLIMGFIVFSLIRSGGNIVFIGSIFVTVCIITTIISILLAIFTKHRSWCAICPMGAMQQHIGRLNSKK